MFVVSLPVWLITLADGGETKATQSLRLLAILSIIYCCVTTEELPVIIKEISTSSGLVNSPQAVCYSASFGWSSTPPESTQVCGVAIVAKAVFEEASPQVVDVVE